MTVTNGIGSALRSARTARGMSLSDIAGDAGISVATLSRIETDKQNVDVPLLLTLARLLHVTPAVLLDGGITAEAAVDLGALAYVLGALPSEQRAQVFIEALKQSRKGTRSREALHDRLDSMLAVLDLIENEMRGIQRDVKKRR